MKAVQTKNAVTAAAQPKSGQAFFRKKGEEAAVVPERDAFFSINDKTERNQRPPDSFFQKPTRPFVQTKLTVGRAGDPYEQEADAIADKVVQRLAQPDAAPEKSTVRDGGSPTPSPSLAPRLQLKCAECEQEEMEQLEEGPAPPEIHRKPTFESDGEPIQMKCTACEQEEKEDPAPPEIHRKPIFESDGDPLQMKCAACEQEEKRLQPKSANDSAPDRGASMNQIESTLSASKGSGSALPEEAQSQMESAIGADFSGVRIHTGGAAVQMNRDLQAQAFTHGSDIYFNAGKYDTESTTGKRLLGHELVHVVQQGGGQNQLSKKEHPFLSVNPPVIQRYSLGEFWDDVSSGAESAYDTATEFGEDVIDTASDITETAVDTALDMGERVYDTAADLTEGAIDTARNVGGSIYDAASRAVDVATETVGGIVDWLATEVGQRIQRMVDRLGGIVSITSGGLVITIPGICPISAIVKKINLPSLDGSKTVPIFAIPIGPDLFITGEVGVAGSLTPELQAQIGPICLDGVRILINPFTNNYSISGSVSATVAGLLSAEARGGLTGQLSLTAVIPVGPVPVPISIPTVGLEGGVAAKLSGTGIAKWTIGGGLSYGGGDIGISGFSRLDLGVAANAFLGVYGQLSLFGENICRIYWQPLEWQKQLAISLGIGADLTVGSGGAGLTVAGDLGTIPFENFDLAIKREGFKDDCPLITDLCALLRRFELLPSQNQGTWDNYGPGNRLEGPLEVYERDPNIASGSMCRGACGPDCETCESHSFYFYQDPDTGETWRYTHFQRCNTHEGCRQHDAAFDWAAAVHGETGPLAIVMPAHMAGNIECLCNYPALNCAAWIKGMRPYDGEMRFADIAERVGPGGSFQTSIGGEPPFGEQGPDFYHYSKNPPAGDFRSRIERWTSYHTNCAAEASAATGVPLPLFYITTIDFNRALNYIDTENFQTRRFTSIILGRPNIAFHYSNHTPIPEDQYSTQRLTVQSPDCNMGSGSPALPGNQASPPGAGSALPQNAPADSLAEREGFEHYPEVLPSSGWLFGEEGVQVTRASNLVELGIASMGNAEIVYLVGHLLEQIKRDPGMIARENAIIAQIRSDSRYSTQPFYTTETRVVGFGGQRWTSPTEEWGSLSENNPLAHRETWQVAANELTWALRNATVRHWAEVDSAGNITITYHLNDRLDLSGSGGRGEAYNNISEVLGFFYHDLAGGNINLQTRAEWTSVIPSSSRNAVPSESDPAPAASGTATTPPPQNGAVDAPSTRSEQENELLYRWQITANHAKLTYSGPTRPGVNYQSQGHHVWPNTIGGDPNQTLMNIIYTIHQTEMHYGQSPVGSAIIATYGHIYKYVTDRINNDTRFGMAGLNVLQGRRLNHTGSSNSGNGLLITRMRQGDATADELTEFVGQAMINYYGFFRTQSSPQIPVDAYTEGINESIDFNTR